MNTLEGFDASEFQTSVDFPTAKSNGYPFTMLRGAIGATGLDPRFTERVKAAEAAGVITMEYGFAYPATSNAIAEADSACADADKAGGLHIIFLDTEGAGVPSTMTRDELTQFILDWAKRVESHGYVPGCYMNTDFLQHRVNIDTLKHLILWQAQYADKLTVVGGWQPTFWQKSQSGHVPGVSGNVDLDVFFGTQQDLANLCKKKTKRGGNVTLPQSVNMLAWKPPTRDQAQEGACTGETAVEVAEFYQKKLGVSPFVLGSPQFNYAMSRIKEGWLNRNSGSYLSDALNVLVINGMAPEADDPYGAPTEFIAPSEKAKVDAARFKMKSVTPVEPVGGKLSDGIAKALADGDIVPVAAKFNTAFYNPEKFGSASVVDYTKGNMVADEAHAFVLLGYEPSPHNDGTKWFIMQNSWGIGWGGWMAPMNVNDGGVAYVTEETVNTLIYEAYTVQVPSPWPTPAPTPEPTPAPAPLRATFQHTTLKVGQPNTLTLTGTPKAQYSISAKAPASVSVSPFISYGRFDDIGLSTLTIDWPTPGTYTYTVTSDGKTAIAQANWTK